MAYKRHIRSGGTGVQRYLVSSGVRQVNTKYLPYSRQSGGTRIIIVYGQVLKDHNITSVLKTQVPRTQVPHEAWLN